MIDHVIYLYGFNLHFAKMLVDDISADQLCQQPGGVVNHPAWTLGHLVSSADHLAQFLGKESALPEGWEETFKTGGTPGPNAADYPPKAELLSTLEAQHNRVVEAVKIADKSTFAEPHPNEGTRKYFPTKGDMIIFLMTSHEMDHLGQVAAWRRAMGLGSATGV